MKLYVALMSLVNSLRSDEEGATAVEYALIVSLIAIFIIGAVTALGTALAGQFNTISGKL